MSYELVLALLSAAARAAAEPAPEGAVARAGSPVHDGLADPTVLGLTIDPRAPCVLDVAGPRGVRSRRTSER